MHAHKYFENVCCFTVISRKDDSRYILIASNIIYTFKLLSAEMNHNVA